MTAPCFSGRTAAVFQPQLVARASRRQSRRGLHHAQRRPQCNLHSPQQPGGWEDPDNHPFLRSSSSSFGSGLSSNDVSARASRFGDSSPTNTEDWDFEDLGTAGGIPWPSNLPTNPGGPTQPPLEFYPTSQLDLDWGLLGAGTEQGSAPTSAPPGGSKIYVILFGVGAAETEGIYSLRAVAKDDGLPSDTIVAFENQDDATRYATLLEATMEHEPTVWPIDWGELLEFCNSAGYRCRLEPEGSLLVPPDYNVGMTDWEKSLRLRKGEFSVLGEEPLVRSPEEALLDGSLDPSFWQVESASSDPEEEPEQAQQVNVIDSQLSTPAGLEAARQSLERLLPRE